MISSRQQLIDYALRKLGAPVINISVAPEQVEDRIDEALQFYQDFHYDATERLYLNHQITGTEITVADATSFLLGEKCTTVRGIHFIIKLKLGNILTVNNVYNALGIPKQTFLANEIITGQTSGAVTTVISKVPGNTETGHVPVSDMVTGVARVLPWGGSGGGSAGTNYFDPKYQLMMSTFDTLGSSSMIYYAQAMSHLALIDQMLKPVDTIRFNRKMSNVIIDMDWANATIGQFLVFDCFRILDPAVFTGIYNDRMLKKLITAKVKYQWASNTQKYQGIQLLGGVTVDASTLMAQAVAEIESAETEIRDSYELPAIGQVG